MAKRCVLIAGHTRTTEVARIRWNSKLILITHHVQHTHDHVCDMLLIHGHIIIILLIHTHRQSNRVNSYTDIHVFDNWKRIPLSRHNCSTYRTVRWSARNAFRLLYNYHCSHTRTVDWQCCICSWPTRKHENWLKCCSKFEKIWKMSEISEIKKLKPSYILIAIRYQITWCVILVHTAYILNSNIAVHTAAHSTASCRCILIRIVFGQCTDRILNYTNWLLYTSTI